MSGDMFELFDKMGDNLIVTLSGVSAGSLSTFSGLAGLDPELLVGCVATAGIVARVSLERAWGRRHRQACREARKLARLRASLSPKGRTEMVYVLALDDMQ